MSEAVTRPIKHEADAVSVCALIGNRTPPFTVTISDGLPRSNDQNHLQRLWCKEVAAQMGDRTAEEVRGHCKLHFGVPIMRRDHEGFAEKYDRIIKPLPYETKLEMMMEPLDFPVTRLMSRKQKTEYLDAFHAYWSQQGCVLTMPKEKGRK
ncbi:hypothetical protein PE067_09145 [Paracoccus sp. DMF-8]|uniref:hypothetical protein n=1 Tax=Paracoccus sp. DMF-8 TaxID=3019445 RepID=UPI0023E85198|nr:hypothetical protein [Paracoccus sp. DMF-8]MDF3606283.1 hypothetical protein [Paracoccus sp. DMF-8]